MAPSKLRACCSMLALIPTSGTRNTMRRRSAGPSISAGLISLRSFASAEDSPDCCRLASCGCDCRSMKNGEGRGNAFIHKADYANGLNDEDLQRSLFIHVWLGVPLSLAELPAYSTCSRRSRKSDSRLACLI